MPAKDPIDGRADIGRYPAVQISISELPAPRTFGLAVRTYANLRLAEKHPVVHNLVISNVPGPPVPLYFMGARIEALYPLGPVFCRLSHRILIARQHQVLPAAKQQWAGAERKRNPCR